MWRFLSWAATGLGMAAAVVVLYLFAPGAYAFYPRCVLHATTGISCPGCGSLRAGHALLHGEFATAFHFNPLLIIFLPVAGLVALHQWLRKRRGHGLTRLLDHPGWPWALLGVIVLFTIGRNLPCGPLAAFNP